MKIQHLFEQRTLPNPYYHGTTVTFKQFDPNFSARQGTSQGQAAYGPGYYFTNNYYLAKNHAGPNGGVWRVKIKSDRVIQFNQLNFNEQDCNRILESYPDSKELIENIKNTQGIRNIDIIIELQNFFNNDINKTCKVLTDLGMSAMITPLNDKSAGKSYEEVVTVFSVDAIIDPQFTPYDDLI